MLLLPSTDSFDCFTGLACHKQRAEALCISWQCKIAKRCWYQIQHINDLLSHALKSTYPSVNFFSILCGSLQNSLKTTASVLFLTFCIVTDAAFLSAMNLKKDEGCSKKLLALVQSLQSYHALDEEIYGRFDSIEYLTLQKGYSEANHQMGSLDEMVSAVDS